MLCLARISHGNASANFPLRQVRPPFSRKDLREFCCKDCPGCSELASQIAVSVDERPSERLP